MCAYSPRSYRKASLAFGTMLTALPVAVAPQTAAFTHPPASVRPVRSAPAARTLYERQDHRMLPVGTKIYYASAGLRGAMTYVYPGKPVPPTFALRPPDVVVVAPDDPRGADEIQRLKHPALCCPTKTH